MTTHRLNPFSLGPGLTPREAALDAVYRFIQGMDFNDEVILRSAFTTNAVFDLSGAATTAPPTTTATPTPQQPREFRGVDAIVTAVQAGVGPMTTAHYLSNPRVRLAAGGREAVITAYALAQHFLPGEGVGGPERRKYLMGNCYAVDVVREEGAEEVWRISRFELTTLWSDGDVSVLKGS